MKLILALDNGGTKCEAALLREDGVVLSRGLCRVPGVSGRSEEATQRAATEALRAAPKKIPELRVASHGEILSKSFFSKRVSRLETFFVTEEKAAFALTGHKHGIVVLAGTGAFVHAKLRDGRELHLDGLGPLLGDYGGGFFIGRQALRAAASSSWHPRRKTSLQQTVFDAYGAKSVDDLIPLNWTIRDRSEIARLTPLVDAAANNGDRMAKQILEEAADALAETLRDAVASLRIRNESYSLIGTGGVAMNSKIYWRRFCRSAKTIAPHFKPELTPLPAVAGIALAALEDLRAADSRALRKNLFASFEKFREKK